MTKNFQKAFEKEIKKASRENAVLRILTLKVNKDTFDGAVKGDQGIINKGITSKNLSKFFGSRIFRAYSLFRYRDR